MRRRSSTLSHDQPDGGKANLGASMNSNYTTTSDTVTSTDSEDSQPGTPTPDAKESFDYYAASSAVSVDLLINVCV